MFIYKIINTKTNKEYIGQTTQRPPIKRWYDHLYKLKGNKHKNPRLQNSFNKHGQKHFTFVVLCECSTLVELNAREEREILERTPWFNLRNGGHNGGKLHESTKNKLRKANLGKKYSLETRQKQSMARKGIPRSDSTKEKIRQTLLGRKRPREVIDKVALALTGRSVPTEVRNRISKTMLGRNAKPCTLVSPEGEVVQIANLAEFERQTGMSANKLRQVANGTKKSYKGWTLHIIKEQT